MLFLFFSQDLNGWIDKHCEVEVVDMVLRLRSKMAGADKLCIPEPTKEKLHSQMNTLLTALPEDLRLVLETS